jgi:hypothetical protein
MHPRQYHGTYHVGAVAMTVITWQRSADRKVCVAEAPGGELLTVTMVSRTSWLPAVIGTDGRTWWRGTPYKSRLEAQRYAEEQAASPEGGEW